jgi:hypothetical protein
MGFFKYLTEKLEAQQIYNGLKGKYETRFKVEGAEYAFLATSIAGEYEDNTQWMIEFENIKSHRIGTLDNNPKIIKAFTEAVEQWVKEYNPHCFYTYGSHIESLQKILESVKKKIKGYNLIDSTEDTKTESGEVIEGNPVGVIKWTKMVEQEVVDSEELSNTKQAEFEKTYEEPQDVKANKEFMSGTKKTDNLDKGDGAYDLKTESVEEYYKKYKDKMKGSSKKTLEGWISGIGKALSSEDKNKLRKKIGLPIKESADDNLMGKKGETVKIVSQGKGESKKYRLVKPDGSKLIDMDFDSESEARKYANKKGMKVQSESFDEFKKRMLNEKVNQINKRG